MSGTIKATVLKYSKFGDPLEVIEKLEESIETTVSGSQILVKINLSTLNPADVITIRGLFPFLPSILSS